MMHAPTQPVRSFTLVETMVAISIISIAIVGPLYEATRAYSNSIGARDQLVATALAQEAVEHIRAIRDDNYLYTLANPATPHTWLNGLSACLSTDCTIDVTQPAPFDVGSQLTPLYLNTNFLYTQQQAGDSLVSIYTRRARITAVNAHESQVVVTVTWTNRQGAHTTAVTDYIDNWL